MISDLVNLMVSVSHLVCWSFSGRYSPQGNDWTVAMITRPGKFCSFGQALFHICYRVLGVGLSGRAHT